MSATTSPPVSGAPIAGPGIARPGDNQPPGERNGYQDTRDEFLKLTANQLKGLDVWEKRETLDDDLAPLARDYQAGLKKLKKEGDESRKAENRPQDDAIKAANKWWNAEIEKLDKALALITAKLDAYIKAKDRQRIAEESAARERLLQAERDAEAARLSAAHATSASARIEAESRADAAAEQARAAAKEVKAAGEPTRVGSATGLANNAGMRKVWSCKIEDRKKAIAFILLTNPEAFDEVITQLAGAALKNAPIENGEKQIPTFAGVTFSFEKVYK